jgi:hypothetical protein
VERNRVPYGKNRRAVIKIPVPRPPPPTSPAITERQQRFIRKSRSADMFKHPHGCNMRMTLFQGSETQRLPELSKANPQAPS